MPRLEFFVVSQSLSIDQTTNLSSVFDILEEVRTERFPLVINHCAAFALFRIEPGDEETDWQALLRIHLPGGENRDFALNVRFTPGSTRHRIALRVQGLTIAQVGDVRFELMLNGQHVAEHLVAIMQAEPLDIASIPISTAHPH